MTIKVKSALAAVLATAVVGGAMMAPVSAEAQRDRGLRYGNTRQSWEQIKRLVDRAEDNSNEFRANFERWEREWDDRDYRDDRYNRDNRDYRGDPYNRDRDLNYRRDPRTGQYYNDRDYRDGRSYRDDRTRYDDPRDRDRIDRYYNDYNNSRYRDRTDGRYNDRYYGGGSWGNMKQIVQRMDEGMERLDRETDDRNNSASVRATLSQVLRDARIVDSFMRDNRMNTRSSGQMRSHWSRLRNDLNALAQTFGMQRV